MLLTGRSVLVTGGTGTFGHAFVRRAIEGHASRIVVVSRDEKKQADMASEFADHARKLRFFIGDVCDRERMERAMRGVDFVVHAAAMKRIDTCEENPAEAVRTNVAGTMAVADACIAAGVEAAVFLSTDKAAAPVTLYGASKLAAERLWVRSNVYAAGSTRFVATRYGNVLGSRGSVVEAWRKQGAGNLRVTDHRMTRFWMTIQDAVDLVLTALKWGGPGGEVFIPKCKAAPILMLAHAVVGPHFHYDETGIRRGEKLHETLIAPDEARYVEDRGDLFVLKPDVTWDSRIRWEQAGGHPLRLREGEEYSSHTAPQWTVDELRGML